MTPLMEQAIARLRSLPEAEQDVFAAFFLHELSEDERWKTTTEKNAENIKRLVDRGQIPPAL